MSTTTKGSGRVGVRWLTAVTVLVVLALGIGLLRRPAPAVQAAPAELPAIHVPSRDVRQTLQLPGQFVPFEEIDADAKVRGYVRSLSVDIGDVVHSGQVIAELEIPELADDLARARAEVARAEQEEARARAESGDASLTYSRVQAVQHERPELLAQADIDAAKAKSDAAAASLVAAQSAVQAARAQVGRVEHLRDYTHITAPFNGVVTRRLVNVGALVGEGSGESPIFHIATLGKLRLVAQVPESAVPDVAVGGPADVSVAALDAPLRLRVSRMSRQLQEDTRTMRVELDYENAGGRVTPGMYARLRLLVHDHPGVPAVPMGCLHDRRGERATAYVIAPDGHAQSRAVTTGLQDPNWVEITSGLRPGEVVVLDVVPDTGPGARYQPRFPPPAPTESTAGAD